MSETELIVTTTSDPQYIAEAAARDDEAGSRVPEPAPEVESNDGSTVVSYNHPRSERALLLERLAEAEADLAEVTERVSSTDLPTDESGPNEAEPENIDLAAVRAAATQDAIEAARARHAYYEEQQASHLAAQPASDPLRGELESRFAEQLQGMGADLKPLRESDVIIHRAVGDMLLLHPGGPETAIWLAENPDTARELAVMSEQDAIKEVKKLAARFDARNRRPMSQAPAPINPVRGSSTRSSVPLDELPYQEFARVREQQERNRYRR
jgi:hypothetical protein